MLEVPEVVAASAYAFGRFRLETVARQLKRDGNVVPLPTKAFDTLLVLVRNRHRVVEKEDLIKQVWPDTFVSDHNLTQNISVLRQALGDLSNQPEFILTVARHGYRFIAPATEMPSDEGTVPVEWRSSESPIIAAPEAGRSTDAGPIVRAQRRWLWIPAATAAIVALWVFIRALWFVAPVPVVGALRFTINSPAGTNWISGGTLSPDGRHVAFVAEDRLRESRLCIRTLAGADSRPLTGTEGATQPFWSPDSRRIGFFAGGKLKTVAIDSEATETIATVGSFPVGGSWSTGGQILFGDLLSGLFLVSASGGDVTLVSRSDPAKEENRWPQFLPDGRHFLYLVNSADPRHTGIYVGSIASADRVRVLDTSGSRTQAVNLETTYAPSGHLLYMRDRALMAQRFDVNQLRLLGPPVTVAANVTPAGLPPMGAVLSAAANGLISFGGGQKSRMVWFNRSGERLGEIETPTSLHSPNLSPNEKQLIATSPEKPSSLWVIDLDRGSTTRLTGDAWLPVWSPAGDRVAFSSTPGTGDIYMRAVAGPGENELLLQTSQAKWVTDWSRDGRYISYISSNAGTQKLDLWVVPTFGERRPRPFLQTSFNVRGGRISPDGRWMAYSSDEAGRWEVYVQSFRVPGQKQAVSIGGGVQPQWRRDGRELFFLAPDGTMMVVEVGSGDAWHAERPRALFQARSIRKGGRNNYAVSADGQRFVIDSVEGSDPITLLANWAY